RRLRQGDARFPGPAAVLRPVLRHADPLPRQTPVRQRPGSARGSRPMIIEAILLTVITASTPLVIAALGELVTERSGVLNLGVEGMMIMGAVCAFAGATLSGSPYLGIVTGILGGAIFSLLFGFLTLTLVANQVATGLALTILGLGISGMLGEPFLGVAGTKLPQINIP